MSVSVVIPTYNEEKYVGKLLESLLGQSFSEFEVIVSDGDSSDGTRRVVAKYRRFFLIRKIKLKFVSSKKRSPGAQRNVGAKLAKFSRILFVDADVILSRDFLLKAMVELRINRLDLAQPRLLPDNDEIFYRVLFKGLNLGLMLAMKTRPRGGTQTLFSTKKLHRKVGGFDEEVRLGEDVFYVHMASKLGFKLGILRGSSVFVSTRRMQREGRFKSIYNTFYHEMLIGHLGLRRAQQFIQREYGNY